MQATLFYTHVLIATIAGITLHASNQVNTFTVTNKCPQQVTTPPAPANSTVRSTLVMVGPCITVELSLTDNNGSNNVTVQKNIVLPGKTITFTIPSHQHISGITVKYPNGEQRSYGDLASCTNGSMDIYTEKAVINCQQSLEF